MTDWFVSTGLATSDSYVPYMYRKYHEKVISSIQGISKYVGNLPHSDKTDKNNKTISYKTASFGDTDLQRMHLKIVFGVIYNYTGCLLITCQYLRG